jgi:predicted ATPase
MRIMSLREVRLEPEAPSNGYPFDLPAVRGLPLAFTAPVCVLVGDNGTGKSTLIEAIAVAAGFNAEGGSGQVQFATTATHSELNRYLRLVWSPRLQPGFFLRAESFYNVASYRQANPGQGAERSYHEMSHGESFLDVARSWFDQPSLFVLDEPEAALSFHGQLALTDAMLDAVARGAQFLVATHSPVLMAFPEACLYQLDESGITRRSFDDLEVVALWRSFLDHPERFLRHLGSEPSSDP